MKGTVLIARVLGRWWLIVKWTHISAIPGCVPFCNITFPLFLLRGGFSLLSFESGLGHKTCFHQWNIRKCVIRKRLKVLAQWTFPDFATLGSFVTPTVWRSQGWPPGGWVMPQLTAGTHWHLSHLQPWWSIYPPVNTQTCEQNQNASCFKPLRFRVVCDAVKANLYSTLWAECLCPKTHVEIPTPKAMVDINRWGLWKGLMPWGWSPHEGVSALIKEAPEGFLAPSTMWWHNKNSETWKRVLTPPCWFLDLRLSTSNTVKNTFLMFISHPGCGVLSLQPWQWKTQSIFPCENTWYFHF